MRKFVVFILLVFSTVQSCKETFDFDIEARTKISVFCILSANKPVKVRVSECYPIDSTLNWRLVNYAYVEIKDDEGNSEILKDSTTCVFEEDTFYYSTNIYPVSGKTYYLKVFVEGYDTLYASTTVPEKPIVDSVWHDKDRVRYQDVLGYPLKIAIQDNCEENYYYFTTKTYFALKDADKPLHGNKWLLYSDKYFNCNEHTFDFIVHSGYDTTVNLFSANSDLYYYLETSILQHESREYELFAEPVTVYSNIENGLGIFAAISQAIVIQ